VKLQLATKLSTTREIAHQFLIELHGFAERLLGFLQSACPLLK
jgi:hypothetical protein